MRDRAAAVHVPRNGADRDRHRARDQQQRVRRAAAADRRHRDVRSAVHEDRHRRLHDGERHRARRCGACRTPAPPRRGSARRCPTRAAPLGILATNALYDRWRSTGFNYNRGRANMISRALLCHDFLASDIVDRHDGRSLRSRRRRQRGGRRTRRARAATRRSIRSRATVHVPHQLAPVQIDRVPGHVLSPATSEPWMTTNKRPPMFFGEHGGGTSTGLGTAIAERSAVRACTAMRLRVVLHRGRAGPTLSGAWVARLQKAFVDSDYNAKAAREGDRAVRRVPRLARHRRDAAETTVGSSRCGPSSCIACSRDLTGFTGRRQHRQAARHSVRQPRICSRATSSASACSPAASTRTS